MGQFLKNYVISGGLLLLLVACVGQGGPGGPSGGPLGAPPSGTDFGLGSSATGPQESVVAQAAPEMPDLPVAPQTDMEDPKIKVKKVEYRIEGRITAVCRDSGDQRVRKSIEAQLFCRWEGSQDPYIVCGKGRYLYIHDPETHNFLNTRTTESDSRFDFNFLFNIDTANVGLKSFSRSHKMLLAAKFDPSKDSQSEKAGKSDAFYYRDSNVSIPETPYDPPDIFGEPNDKADKDNPSDESDLIVYAWSLSYSPSVLGEQVFCSYPKMCEPGGVNTLKSFIRLGPIEFLDNNFAGADLPDPLPACD
ncbi:MAG: hypothetical protein R3257_08105 [bacterium]|nr:hypothetical protein [bacterium]